MKLIFGLTLLVATLLPLAPSQAADIAPLPSVSIGYMWTKDQGGPALALPWELKDWKLGPVRAALDIDLVFGGTTEVVNGSLPAAAGVGLTLSDAAKKMHAAVLYTTAGKLAGFLGWQVLEF